MRCDGKMSYKDFIFPVNPRTITIRTDRHVALSAVPGGSDVVSDLGSGARIVSGEGEFFGEGAVQSFLRLRQVMSLIICSAQMRWVIALLPVTAHSALLILTTDLHRPWVSVCPVCS